MNDDHHHNHYDDLNIPYEIKRAWIWRNPDEAARLWNQSLWWTLYLFIACVILTIIVDGLGIKW